MLTDVKAVRQTHSTPRSDTANNKLNILGNMTTPASQTEERSRRMKLALLERLSRQPITGERNWTRSSLYDF